MEKQNFEQENLAEKNAADEPLDVSKTILRTGFITAVAFLLVLVLVISITALISPSLMSEASLKIGAKNTSARFAVAQYERTKDINDLATAVERSISCKNYKNIAKYSEILVNFENKSGNKIFKNFCEDFKDKNLNEYYKENKINMVSDYYNFIYGNYVYSLYKTNEKFKAYDIAFSIVVERNYITNNPVTKYINAYIEDSKRTANDDLLEKLQKMYYKLDLDNNKAENSYGLNICIDLKRLYDTLGDVTKAMEWETEYGLTKQKF